MSFEMYNRNVRTLELHGLLCVFGLYETTMSGLGTWCNTSCRIYVDSIYLKILTQTTARAHRIKYDISLCVCC